MKNLLLILSLVMIASPAFASRARLESLGENANGSYYINDSRDIFLDPAAINSYKKKVFVELGDSNDTADTVNAGASKVQGGFTNTFGDFVYGLYVGRESSRVQNAIANANVALAANSFGTLIAPDHAFDFFFGGEAGSVKYGADVFYSSAFVQVPANALLDIKSAHALGIKLGADINALKVFTTLGLSSEYKNDSQRAAGLVDAKGNLSLDLGATYGMEDMTYLAKFTTFSTDTSLGTTSPTVQTNKTTAFAVGAGWKHEASKSVTMYSRIQLDIQKDTIDTVVAAAPSVNGLTENWYNLPLTLGAEAQATSWLTVRGSISHSLVGQHQNGASKDSLNNITTAAMGLGFNFGDLTIDALVGQQGAVAGANGASETSQSMVQSGTQQGFGSNMLTRLAMTYNF